MKEKTQNPKSPTEHKSHGQANKTDQAVGMLVSQTVSVTVLDSRPQEGEWAEGDKPCVKERSSVLRERRQT